MAYMLKVDSLAFEVLYVMPNVIFYTMEMKHILCKNLTMNIGEIGPVEIELIFTSLILTGWWFGNEVYQKTMGELTGIENDYVAGVPLKYACGGPLVLLTSIFLQENLGDCMKESISKSVYLFTPMVL